MARRMFSEEVTNSDAFLDMPSGSQLLYFHLGIQADDDGFISSPKMVMRVIGSSEDELKVLFAKKFLLAFESGVCVVKHWRINNYIRKQVYKGTKYTRERKQLYIRDNGAYTFNPEGAKALPEGHFTTKENESNGAVDSTSTQRRPRLGKVRLGKVSNTLRTKRARTTPKIKKTPEYNPLGAEILKAFEEVDAKNKTYYGNKTQRSAADFLITEYGLEQVLKVIALLPKTNNISYFPSINSPYELKEKWAKLEGAMIRKKGEGISKGRGVEE